MRQFGRAPLVPLILAALALLASARCASAQGGAPGVRTGGPAVHAGLAAAPASPRDYLAEVRAAYTPENRAYTTRRRLLDLADPLVTVLIAFLLLATGLSAAFQRVAERIAKRRYFQVLAYLVQFAAVTWILGLPLEWYGGYALEHRFGLSTQSLGAWFGDSAKGLGMGVFLLGVCPVAWLVYRALRSQPRRWWLRLALGTVPFMMLYMLVEPVLVEPAFNKFRPLQNAELRGRILDLAARAQIPGRKVLEVDRSKQTRQLNAYVSGFGASQRIVLWDTTLRSMREDEILFVMAHEMGHYKLGHAWKLVLFYGVLGFGVFWLVGGIVNRLAARHGPRWGIHEVGDLASMPLLLAAIAVVAFLAQPVTNSFSRWMEHEADVFGLEVTHANDAGARAFIKLAEQNKSDPEPSPFMEAWLYTHPPLVERVRFTMDYRPWEEGRPNQKFKPKA
jgi:Zn-dependent protease with chaperone function